MVGFGVSGVDPSRSINLDVHSNLK